MSHTRHVNKHKVCKNISKKYNRSLSEIYDSTNQDIWQIEVDTTMKMIGVSFTADLLFNGYD